MGDWLGTHRVATHRRQYLPFKKARSYVHGLRLKSQAEWRAYCKSGEKPDDIPANPWQVYAGKGWVGLGDWLGTAVTCNSFAQVSSFQESACLRARARTEISCEVAGLLQVREEARRHPRQSAERIREDGLDLMGRLARDRQDC